MSSTNANGTLPRGWQTDWVIAEDVHRQIAEGVRSGRSDQAVAMRVGVSSRTVQRYRQRNNLAANAVNQHGPKSGDSGNPPAVKG